MSEREMLYTLTDEQVLLIARTFFRMTEEGDQFRKILRSEERRKVIRNMLSAL